MFRTRVWFGFRLDLMLGPDCVVLVLYSNVVGLDLCMFLSIIILIFQAAKKNVLDMPLTALVLLPN